MNPFSFFGSFSRSIVGRSIVFGLFSGAGLLPFGYLLDTDLQGLTFVYALALLALSPPLLAMFYSPEKQRETSWGDAHVALVFPILGAIASFFVFYAFGVRAMMSNGILCMLTMLPGMMIGVAGLLFVHNRQAGLVLSEFYYPWQQ